MKFCFLPVLGFSLLFQAASGQSQQVIEDSLYLSGSGSKIENYISFSTSGANYENIKATTGQKIPVKATSLVINGDTLNPEEIRTRGQTTLYYRRKSYSFGLTTEASFRHGGIKKKMDKFYLLSLSMDKNYCCNRLAFEMMEKAGIFGLFYAFCELRINGQSEGVCMIIERPEDWALKKKDSPLVLRRGYNSSIDKIKTGRKTEKEQINIYRGYFRQIYRAVYKFQGEELYNALSGLLDVDGYMKWLAFNFFVRNGDYTDEVYFYIDPDTKKYAIIPWDYDDLFKANPHEGNVESRKSIGDKLFFSTEDILDRKIVEDAYLYNKYLDQFRELMNSLSSDVLRKDFEATYFELYPYYSTPEIISKSEYDLYKGADLPGLKSDMISLFNQLLIYRNIYLKYLNDNN